MALNTNGRNAMLQGGLGNAVTHLSLHVGAPGDTGANEIATGGIYARQAVAWTAVGAGQRSNSAVISFDVPGGSEVLYVGFWNALAAGTFFGYAPLNGSRVGVAVATAADNILRSPGHGLEDADKVVMINVLSESLPGGLSEDIVYHVRDVTAGSFKISATSGGAALDITSDGELVWQQVQPESFGSDASLTIATNALILDGAVV